MVITFLHETTKDTDINEWEKKQFSRHLAEGKWFWEKIKMGKPYD